MNKQELEELHEWPCQDLHGGRGAAIYNNIGGMCKHPECHPKNDDRTVSNKKLNRKGGGEEEA